MTSPDRLALAAPIPDPDVPVIELAATTRREEARSAMATVAALTDAGVNVRDLAVVARDLDDYEEPLSRAAIQYGVTPVFWTQLRVTHTTPFALFDAVCAVLAGSDCDAETLCRPLEYGWCPPVTVNSSTTAPDETSAVVGGTTSPQDSTDTAACRSTDREQYSPDQRQKQYPLDRRQKRWPLDQRQIQSAREALPDDSRSLAEWHDVCREMDSSDDHLQTYVDWLRSRPAPTPAAVSTVCRSVLDAYEQHGLPVTKADDSPALIETEREARAVVRVRTLAEQLQHKYADRLAEGTLTQSWSDVADLARVIATQRPGRREHSNAHAIDILEANDVWHLDIPYVIVVGLIDGEWPRPAESTVPPELQEIVLAGAEGTDSLAPRTAWTDGRDRDQFADAIRAASRAVILTRHTETLDGDPRRRSPLLADIDCTTVDSDPLRRLLGPDRTLPASLRDCLDAPEAGSNRDGGTTDD